MAVTLVLSSAMAWRSRLFALEDREFDPEPHGRLIAALDASIQKRFKEIDQRFGIYRVSGPWSAPHMFRPEDVTELSVVAALDNAHLRVVLYLTGRGVQRPKPDTLQASVVAAGRLIKGPVTITPTQTPMAMATSGDSEAPPPSALDLWDESRRAFAEFARSGSHEFDLEGWRFTAKPVRASDASCLECHARSRVTLVPSAPSVTPLQLGDALGVVLYGYQPR